MAARWPPYLSIPKDVCESCADWLKFEGKGARRHGDLRFNSIYNSILFYSNFEMTS